MYERSQGVSVCVMYPQPIHSNTTITHTLTQHQHPPTQQTTPQQHSIPETHMSGRQWTVHPVANPTHWNHSGAMQDGCVAKT